MDKTSKDNLANDIESRLDDFFGESNNSSQEQTPAGSLKSLKSVVLSIDWEITDACLDDLNRETDALLPQYQSDRLIHALLRMLKALGHYIRTLKAQAHPDAIKRVMSTFQSLEVLTSGSQLSEEKKKRILAKEIAAFKELKEQVESRRSNLTTAAAAPTSGAGGEYSNSFVENHRFEQAMSEVEKRLNEQVAQLKAQLENVQKEINTLRKR